MAEAFKRISMLEQNQVRVDTQLTPALERLERLETWQIEMKVLVAKWLVIYGGLSVIGQFIITVAIQYAVHQITR